MEPPARRGSPPRTSAPGPPRAPQVSWIIGPAATCEHHVPPGRPSFPALPQTRDHLLSQYVTSQDQPAPTVPADQTLPIQPPGHRRPTP